MKCDTIYKTASSLASHRYRNHPHSSSVASPEERSDVQFSPSKNSVDITMSTHDVSIKNLQSAIHQLRGLYEDLELIVDQHDKSLDWMKTEIGDKELISGGDRNDTSKTQQHQDVSSDSSSGSDSDEISESANNSVSPNRRRNNATPIKRRLIGL